MTPSDELFHLIKSLTPSEKRYFKIHASKHVIGKSNHYEKLFDALDVLPYDQPYDEAAFKKSLRGKSYGTHLSDEKSHLREMILRAMRVYHAERTPKGQLVEMMHEISFLYSKGFVKSCHQMIDKAMKLAEETEQYTEMLVLNDFMVNLYKDHIEAPYTVAELEHREKELFDKISIARQAIYLRLKMTDIQNRMQWKEREEEAKVYMDAATKLSSRDDISTRVSLLLLNVRQFYLAHYHRFSESLEITTQWLKKAEKESKVFEYLSDQYRIALANYLMCAMHCEKFEIFPEAIGKLKSCKTESEKEEADSFRLITQYELVYLLNSTEQKDTGTILEEIEKGLRKYDRFMPVVEKAHFRFNIALLLFLQKNYSESLGHIHTLDHISGRAKVYERTTIMARFMEWICQSATGNHDILDSGLRNLKRYVDEKKVRNELFDHVLKLFDAVIKDGNKKSPSLKVHKEKISAIKPNAEWEQLQAIILAWL